VIIGVDDSLQARVKQFLISREHRVIRFDGIEISLLQGEARVSKFQDSKESHG
jgi:hypothetical protein